MRRLIVAVLLLSAAPAALEAQNTDVDGRVDRLEREVRAMQREVFPGGSGEFFEPEIRPGVPAASNPGNPASEPITDLLDRINAVERQLATLTGQVEENSYRLRQIDATIAGMQSASTVGETTEDTLDDEGPGFGDVAPPAARPATENGRPAEGSEESEEREEPAVSGNLRAMAQAEENAGSADGGAVSSAEGPLRAEGAEPPLPEDLAEASYVRGYRLWRDGNFEGARSQLREAIEDHPGDRFESYSRNLLGRAYLDDGKPASATEIFVRNYQELPNGERAADSLFFLGVALTQLDYKDRACLAFGELQEVYGDTLRSDIAEQLPSARSEAECR